MGSLIDLLTNSGIDQPEIYLVQITGDSRQIVIDALLATDEFKGVKKINTVWPTYLADSVTQEPLLHKKEFLGSSSVKPMVVESFMVHPNDTNRFNEEIDLCGVFLSPKMYDPSFNLDYGVWKSPIQYDPNTFTPYNTITIKYSIEDMVNIKQISTNEAVQQAKEIILKKVSEFLESKESNYPYKQGVIVRCSPRSIKKTIEQHD